MQRGIPERYRWAAYLLDVRPNDNILEIGCGYGHMVGLICERLTSGRITAIDKSPKMAVAAQNANKEHIDSGKAEIILQDLLDSRQPAANFDKIFLFNINAFWMDPVAELAEVKRLLKPEGEFHLFHLPPPGHAIQEFVDQFTSNLIKNGFQVESAGVSSIGGSEVTCIVSRPIRR